MLDPTLFPPVFAPSVRPMSRGRGEHLHPAIRLTPGDGTQTYCLPRFLSDLKNCSLAFSLFQAREHHRSFQCLGVGRSISLQSLPCSRCSADSSAGPCSGQNGHRGLRSGVLVTQGERPVPCCCRGNGSARKWPCQQWPLTIYQGTRDHCTIWGHKPAPGTRSSD